MTTTFSTANAGHGQLTPLILPTPDEVGRHVAASIARALEESNRRRSPFVLGCPSGRSPVPVIAHLAREVGTRGLDLRELQIVMMDEYVVAGSAGGFHAVDPSLPHSCRGFGLRTILGSLNEAAGPERSMTEEQLWCPDPADPAAFEDTLGELGGIDLFLLATGARDGHVAFNPQGSPRDSRTRVVELSESTRMDNVATFPTFERPDNVPTHGVTVGINTILTHSRRAVLVAHGSEKASAVTRIAYAPHYDPGWPSTVVVECRDPSLVIDQAAAMHLPHGR